MTTLELISWVVFTIAVFLWGYLFGIKTNDKKIAELSYKIEQLKNFLNEDMEEENEQRKAD